MSPGQFIVNPTIATVAAILAALLGLLIWFLIRKRQDRLWLPTLRVIDIESKKLPKLKLNLPPVVAFLCFLLASISFTIFSFKPTRQIFTPFEPSQKKYLIFSDLSPSMAAQVSIEQYKNALRSIWDKYQQKIRLLFATSHTSDIFEPKSQQEFEDFLAQINIHRSGLRLGTMVKARLEQFSDPDRIFIVSDGDLHTWADFQWQFLAEDMEVLFVNVSKEYQHTNVYISSVKFNSIEQSQTMDWDVELATTNNKISPNGTLQVYFKNKLLASNHWEFSELKDRLVIKTNWPITEMPEEYLESDHLLFKLDVADSISLDNEFRTLIRGSRKNAIIIAEPSGERALEDTVHHLEKTLEVLNFKMHRLDAVRQPGPGFTDYPLWIVYGGSGLGVDQFCPKSIESYRIAAKDTYPAKSISQLLPKIWLLPHTVNANYSELCHCLARLVISDEPHVTVPPYCENLQTSDQWRGVLLSLGGKQMGGQLGNVQGALAWHFKHQLSGIELIAFTLPLKPSLVTGLRYASLPLIIKELLKWQGVITHQTNAHAAEWPRVDDISALTTEQKSSEAEYFKLLYTNVPIGESLSAYVDLKNLPPSWSAQVDVAEQQSFVRTDRTDPTVWIRTCFILVFFAAAFEALWLIIRKIMKLIKPKVFLSLIAIVMIVDYESSYAQVSVNVLQYHTVQRQIERLSREVGFRTSISLTSEVSNFLQVDDALYNQAWFWVKNMQLVRNDRKQLTSELQIWLKKGGFLVLEDFSSEEELERLTERFLGHSVQESLWQPIPPDHELMRSFHLLDALPSCNDKSWRGFQFDGRLAIIAVPFRFIESLLDNPVTITCKQKLDREILTRVFINLLMVVLATDYKKDQIHLPEILKRLR